MEQKPPSHARNLVQLPFLYALQCRGIREGKKPFLDGPKLLGFCCNLSKLCEYPQNVESGSVPTRVLNSSHKDQKPIHWGHQSLYMKAKLTIPSYQLQKGENIIKRAKDYDVDYQKLLIPMKNDYLNFKHEM